MNNAGNQIGLDEHQKGNKLKYVLITSNKPLMHDVLIS